MTGPDMLESQRVRQEIRAGRITGTSRGLAHGFVQCNLAILPKVYAFDFLLCLDHAHFRQQRRGVNDFLAARAKRVVIPLPVNRRLSHHAIANLRKLREFNAHTAIQFSFAQNVNGHFGRAHHWWARIFCVVETKVADVLVPSRALRLAKLWLDNQKRRLAFSGKKDEVIAFHRPIVRQVQDIVGRTGD